jgi:proline-specific peptidase
VGHDEEVPVSGSKEGHVDVPGGRVWYRIEGPGSTAIPLLVLHGGPGAGHDYLEPLAALANERPVIFYDQLGCGKSDIPDDSTLWNLPRFVEETAAVRAALDLEEVHLLGQSWGGWLAIEYMLTRPSGILSLTLANTSASVSECIEECRALVAQLPDDARATIERCESEGTTDSPEYQAAGFEFYKRHLCRLPDWPDYMMRSLANTAASPVYGFMWGPSEFTVTGNLKDWDRRARLGEIDAPTLILAGRYDEMGIPAQETMNSAISGSRLHIFESSSHTPHAEEPDEFQSVLRGFLADVEGGRA